MGLKGRRERVGDGEGGREKNINSSPGIASLAEGRLSSTPCNSRGIKSLE